MPVVEVKKEDGPETMTATEMRHREKWLTFSEKYARANAENIRYLDNLVDLVNKNFPRYTHGWFDHMRVIAVERIRAHHAAVQAEQQRQKAEALMREHQGLMNLAKGPGGEPDKI